MPSRSPAGVVQVGQVRTSNNTTRVALIIGLPAVSLVLPALAEEIATTGGTSELTRIAAAIAKFLLFYSGVFALIGLSAAVGAGLLASDRIVMTPQHRILAQALHRTTSLLAVAALANHIMLEVMAKRVHLVDGFVPFLSSDRTFFMGLGTIASDLFILIIVTGLLRGRFTTGARPKVWRVLHATAYACWPLGILHGLLAGRSAKPYVDWSYGGLLAIAALALTLRRIMVVRERTASPAVPDPSRTPLPPPTLGTQMFAPIMPPPAAQLAAPAQGPGYADYVQALPPGTYPPGAPYPDDRYPPGAPYPDDRYPPGAPYPDDRYPPDPYEYDDYGPAYDSAAYKYDDEYEYEYEQPQEPGAWPVAEPWAGAGPYDGQDR